MGPQFVDLNDDGIVDFLTATFDGSAHVAYGVEGGFAEPVHILDKHGKAVGLEMRWDLEGKRWQNVFKPQCTSAAAFDWDADGDLDLLLGDYNEGNLYLQRNEGKAGSAAFSGESELVLAGGKPFALPGGLTAPRLVDWNRDGLTDIVCGSFGAKSGSPLGGVHLYLNVGRIGAPEFAEATALVAPAPAMGTAQTRPDIGLYVDPVDLDGDGDLDLVVGGYSLWQPLPGTTDDPADQKVQRQAAVWVYLNEGD